MLSKDLKWSYSTPPNHRKHRYRFDYSFLHRLPSCVFGYMHKTQFYWEYIDIDSDI